MYDAPNAVEELKPPRKYPTAEKVEAIKDALQYFGVIIQDEAKEQGDVILTVDRLTYCIHQC